jgi:hypothetical protein
MAGVEAEINLGRGLRSLRGGRFHGFAGAVAQRPASLAAQVEIHLLPRMDPERFNVHFV